MYLLDSECPTKFKSSVIGSYTIRALTHCSSWDAVDRELEFISQQLVNNGYSNKDIQRITRRALDCGIPRKTRAMIVGIR